MNYCDEEVSSDGSSSTSAVSSVGTSSLESTIITQEELYELFMTSYGTVDNYERVYGGPVTQDPE